MIRILKYNEFVQDAGCYKAMFPQTYTSIDNVKSALQKDYDTTGGGILGIQVSPEWEDKCYGFEFVTDNPVITFEYLGIMKS